MPALPKQPISLIYAAAPEYNPASAFYADGFVSVQAPYALGEVRVHYTYNNILWFSVPADFDTIYDNRQVWHFRLPVTYNSHTCTFALEYRTAGYSYWDNNENSNYILAWLAPAKILNSCSVILGMAYFNNDILYGYGILKNLGLHKQLKVLYSFDNWLTHSSADAAFCEMISDILEKWTFAIPAESSESVQLALQYSVNGSIYPDDNFGKYYTFSL